MFIFTQFKNVRDNFRQTKGSKLSTRFVFSVNLIIILIFLKSDHMSSQVQCAITTSSPVMDFEPPEMQAGNIYFEIGKVVDFDTTTALDAGYIVTLERVKNFPSYILCLGQQGADIPIPIEPANGLWFSIFYSNKLADRFSVYIYINDETQWSYARAAFIAIASSVQNIYTFFHSCTINTTLTTGQYRDFPYSDSSIQPASTSNYYSFVSIFRFKQIYRKTGATSPSVRVQMIQDTTTDYTIRVYSEGHFILGVDVQGLLIDTGLINDQRLRNVILIQDYQYSGATGFTRQYVLEYSGVPFKWTSVFYGFYQFRIVDSIGFDFYVANDNKVELYKYSSTSYVGEFLMVFYNNKCKDPFHYEDSSFSCVLCPERCLSCNSTECFSCQSGFTISSDKASCECAFTIVSGICADFSSGPIKGCITAVDNSTQILCKICSNALNLVSINDECVCKDGFAFDTNRVCYEVCGDGFRTSMQCDDGNLVDGDGCSSTCTVQNGFKCTSNSTYTACKSQMYLNFELTSILKNEDNSALFTFKAIQSLMPFPLLKENFQNSLSNSSSMYKVYLKMRDGSTYQLQAQLKSVQNNQLTFQVGYQFTIEGMDATIYLDMSQTKYTMQSINYSFKSIGKNQPLKFSANLAFFKGSQQGYVGISAVFSLLLIVGLIAPKYIGLEAILTLQLIFYSCLLVIDSQKYPVGFKSFTEFRFSTGYNDIFTFGTSLLDSDLVSKFNFIGIKKTIIQNYNISFVLLFLSFLVFVISLIVRKHIQKGLLQKPSDKLSISKDEAKQMKDQFQFCLKVNEICYRVYNQMSIWSVLQVLCAIAAQISIPNESFILNQQSILLKARGLLWLMGTLFIAIAGLNLFKNILLSGITIGKLEERPSEMLYKKMNLIYLILVGSLIFFLNQQSVTVIYCSVLVMLVHLCYILVLYRIQPYQKSLTIHTMGLFLNQFIYLFFLIFVNLINYLPTIPQIASLIFVYFILLLCLILVIFTVVRLYYEYRFGQKLQIDIQKQRQEEQRQRLTKEQKIFQRKVKTFEEEAKQRLDQKLKKRLKNKYLYENQLMQDEMKEYIQFLDQRPDMKQEKKQDYYFKKYIQKPMDWLKEHEPEKYFQKMIEEQKQRAKRGLKINTRLQDPEYQRVSTRLRKEFLQNQRKTPSSRYNSFYEI